MRTPSDDLPPELVQVLADVEEHGVHVVHVADGGDEDAAGAAARVRAPYSYSIGLFHHFDQPEVVVFGLDEEVAQDLIDLIADEASEGRRFHAGTDHRDLLSHYPVRFLPVPPHWRTRLLGTAALVYGEQPFEVVQLVWPDKQGRWPWSEGVRDGFAGLQPVLERLDPGGDARAAQENGAP